MSAKTNRRSRSYCEVILSEVTDLNEVLDIARIGEQIDREAYDWCRSGLAEIEHAAVGWDNSGPPAARPHGRAR
jgi:hypothetical protein